ncbi:oxidoreductase HTATIP2-like [Montipora capricornis]|uniref:oxidoreductase HTATIP2-like n=1 Tax=Montipora foliosa TaxID=591990 RepID=UPI0035F18E76
MAEGGAEAATSTDSEKSFGMRAVLIGATGAIGECLLGELLISKHISKVVSLGRRNATVPATYSVDQKAEEESGRLEQHVFDFENISMETVGEQFKDKDVFFCSLGTTRRSAGSAAAFRHVDYDYVINCAKVAKEANVPHVLYVSSQRANASSWFLYLQVKGQVEEALKEMQFVKTSIFRPGLLDRGNKKRFGEKLFGLVSSSIPVSKVAKGMVIEAESFARSKQTSDNPQPSAVTYDGNNDIFALLSTT